MNELDAINLIEKLIIVLIVGTMFGFCFWQEWDEKKNEKPKLKTTNKIKS